MNKPLIWLIAAITAAVASLLVITVMTGRGGEHIIGDEIAITSRPGGSLAPSGPAQEGAGETGTAVPVAPLPPVPADEAPGAGPPAGNDTQTGDDADDDGDDD